MRWSFSDLWRGTFSTSTLKWLVLGSLVGMACGVAAFLFYLGIDVGMHVLQGTIANYQAAMPAGEHRLLSRDEHSGPFRPLLLLVILFAGGLIAGILTQAFAPAARGAGNDAAIDAYHRDRGRIPLKTTVVKFFASISTLASGGSAGKEGPIAMIGSGLASVFAGSIHLTGRDRRILLAAGIGAGVAALFRAPLAGAIFAAEVLYADSEMESDVIIPSFISAIIGFVTFGLLEHTIYVGGEGSVFSALFATPDNLAFSVHNAAHLIGYLLIGLGIVVAARLYIITVRSAEQGFAALAIPAWLKPAIGAVAAGCIGLVLFYGAQWSQIELPEPFSYDSVLGVLGSGYGVLQQALLSPTELPAELQGALVGLLLCVALGKMLTTACTVSAGGSGGLFGPSMVIGGCVGGAIGIALSGLPIAPPPAACVIMGMAGFFSCAYRTPIAALLMVSELTGTYELLLPAMWVCALTFLAGNRWSIVTTQVPSPVHSPAHSGHFFNDILAGIRVDEVFDPLRPTRVLHPDSSIDDCKQLVTESQQTVYPIVDQQGNLTGIFNMNDLRSFLYNEHLGLIAVADDIATKDMIVIRPQDTLASAMRRFTVKNLEELPVIEERDDGKRRFLGLLGRRHVIAHYNAVVDRLRRQRADDGYETPGSIT